MSDVDALELRLAELNEKFPGGAAREKARLEERIAEARAKLKRSRGTYSGMDLKDALDLAAKLGCSVRRVSTHGFEYLVSAPNGKVVRVTGHGRKCAPRSLTTILNQIEADR